MKGVVLSRKDHILTIKSFDNVNNIKENDLINFKKAREIRSLSQNSLYWLFCNYVARELQMTAEEVHEGFKQLHLKQVKFINNKEFVTFKSTTELDTEEFALYLEKCNLTALEFGVDTSEFWIEYEQYRG